ncbi:MAG TPA: hypothetical protein VK742_08280 [Candidatus Sulfotelmatobacter sp.]|jgi:hypothetical protein|nr:hypothetical protein [Candidatus Sulfotelmatobacter sp.]
MRITLCFLLAASLVMNFKLFNDATEARARLRTAHVQSLTVADTLGKLRADLDALAVADTNLLTVTQ